MKQFLQDTLRRSGQLQRIASIIRIVTYISLFVWVVIAGLVAAIGALFSGAIGSLILALAESTSGQMIIPPQGGINGYVLIVYIVLMFPFATTLMLHMAMLGFARMLDATADHVNWMRIDVTLKARGY